MTYKLTLEHLPAGIAAHSGDPGEQIQVITRDFATDSDGQKFYIYLEGFEHQFLGPFIASGNRRSSIEYCLVLMEKPNQATVYINELEVILDLIAKKDVNHGDIVEKDDIAGILGLRFNNFSIPENNGIIFFFSVGWRRGFFFDFGPNYAEEKLENINRQLGAFYETLLFNEIFLLSEDDWNKFYALGWFPYISIPSELLKALSSRIIEGRSILLTETNLVDYFTAEKILGFLEKFRKQTFLQPHLPFLEQGIKCYIDGDYLSAINNIWPRIEGILRYAFTLGKPKLSQKDLVDNLKDLVANKSISPTVFFPNQFRDYLLKYYFKDFDVSQGKLDVSRHSIGHGVADVNTYDRKRALIGILMIDQLTYYLQLRRKSTP